MTTTTPSPAVDRTSLLERLLKPQSVAIIGASATLGALGASVIGNLQRAGFPGSVHLVNPNRPDIDGRPCLRSIDDLPLGLDVGALAVPRAAVLDALRSLARRRTGAAVIFAAGFAEAGVDGAAEQREMARIAADAGMLLEGPNCLGFVNYIDRVALTFVETPRPAAGTQPRIGIVSQSGAMAAVLSVMLTSRQLGITYSISTGNEAASGVEDYVEYLLDEVSTRAIGLVVEQFRQPRRFMALARRARALGKILILLHPGRSQAARESATTHTGAMAGDYQTMRVLVERAGVLVADHLEQLGDLLELVTCCPELPQGGCAVMAESGAFKALTLDLAEQIGLPLPELTDNSAPALRAAMPPFVGVSNPLDLTAQPLVDPNMYRRVLAALLPDKRFGSIMLGIIQTDTKTCDLKFPSILSAIEQLQPSTPLIFAGIDEGAAVPSHYISRLRSLQVPYFPSANRALSALAKLSEFAARDWTRREQTVLPLLMQSLPAGTLCEYRAKQLLRQLDFPLPRAQFVTSLAQAQEVATDIGFPIALKAQATWLLHKSDGGGVILNVSGAEELERAWERLHTNLTQHHPGQPLEGVMVEQMASPGVEFIVGGRNDPQWGAVLLVGFGGVQAELLQDIRVLPSDLTNAAIVRALYSLKQGVLLEGYRGSPALDIQALVQLIIGVAELLCSQPSLREIDLNPVMVHPLGRGVTVLDALMRVDAQ